MAPGDYTIQSELVAVDTYTMQPYNIALPTRARKYHFKHPVFFSIENPSQFGIKNSPANPDFGYHIAVPDKAVLAAPADGVVRRVVSASGIQSSLYLVHQVNFVEIDHGDFATRLEHIISASPQGTKVRRGDPVGLAGLYGGDPHIHVYGLREVGSSDRVLLQIDDLPEGYSDEEFEFGQHVYDALFSGMDIEQARGHYWSDSLAQGSVRTLRAAWENRELKLPQIARLLEPMRRRIQRRSA